jgi:hypothetical protein
MSAGDDGARRALDSLLRAALAPLGRGLAAYVTGARDATLLVYVEDLTADPLPVAYFFREPSDMGAIDRTALALARGRVLDVGACAGAHAVPLVRAGHAVTALDLIPETVEILRERGVADARLESVWSFRASDPYDTVLALMNGTSVAGTAGGLVPLLRRLRELTAPEGQLLIDSTELEDPWEEKAAAVAEAEGAPASELHYQLEFDGVRGPPFPQLFVSERALEALALGTGWSFDVAVREDHRYLARLTHRVE